MGAYRLSGVLAKTPEALLQENAGRRARRQAQDLADEGCQLVLAHLCGEDLAVLGAVGPTERASVPDMEAEPVVDVVGLGCLQPLLKFCTLFGGQVHGVVAVS